MTDPSPDDTLPLELHLHDIRDLFVAPEGDPFDPLFRDEAGLDELINAITPLKRRQAFRITVYLPPETITPGLEAETAAALDRHLDRRIRWEKNEMLATRRGGWGSLAYATLLTLIVLAVLGLAYYLELPSWLQAVAYAVFIVVAWVSMWWAAETLLFDSLATRRLIRVLERIRSAGVQLQPEPPSGETWG